MPEDADSCAQVPAHGIISAARTRTPSLLPNIACLLLTARFTTRAEGGQTNSARAVPFLSAKRQVGPTAPEKSLRLTAARGYNRKPFRYPKQGRRPRPA